MLQPLPKSDARQPLRKLDAAAEVWWFTFMQHLGQNGVGETHQVWYRRRVEQLIQRHPGQRSVDVAGAAVEEFLADLGGLGLSDWHLLQAVDALWRFGQYAGAAWAEEVDWAMWRQRFTTNAATPAERAVLERGQLPADGILREFALLLRSRRYSLRTEGTYIDWVERCRHWHRLADASQLNGHHVAPYLSHLAGERAVSGSTQRQALCGLVLFLREMRGQHDVPIHPFVRSTQPRQVPTVLSRNEVAQVLAAFPDATGRLAASLLYGAGLRLLELLRLRVKDVDFAHGMLLILDAKGGASRRTPLPESLVPALQKHLTQTQHQH